MRVLTLVLFFACCALGQSPVTDGKIEDIRIAPDDVLDIVVFREPDLTRTVRVSSSGQISMPVIGNIKVVGLTTDDVAQQIKTLLQKSLVEPDVSVSIKEMATTVSVIGAVKAPGAYPIRGSITLLSLLAKAGSVSENADDTIQVIRKSAAPGIPVLTVPTGDLLRNAKTELNLLIFPGDTVNVVQKEPMGVVMVVGEVLRQGEIQLKSKNGTTVRQALAAAGWFTKEAKKGDAKVIRIHPEDGHKEEIPVNLNKVTDTSFDDVPMKQNDILFVPSSRSKSAFNRTLEAAIGITSGRLIYVGH